MKSPEPEFVIMVQRLSACLNASKRGKSKWAKHFWIKNMKKIYYKHMSERI